MKLIKNAKVYTPEYIGEKDILIVNDKIVKVADDISTPKIGIEIEIIDAKGKYAVPGFIDQHVHIIGGGGEAGFNSRTPETQLTDFTKSGITTVLGLLGTDATCRNLEALLAKARALEADGISTYILTGSYEFPSHTLTGSVRRDIVLIDKVIGVKIAISDHRASYVTTSEMARLAADVRVGGMISKKAGIVTVHLGDGKDNLNTIIKALENSEIPVKHFVPTHINRNKKLYTEAVNYAKKGGYIDFTTDTLPVPDDSDSVKASKGIIKALEAGVNVENITISSDGNGSWSEYDSNGHLLKIGVSKLNMIHLELKDIVFNENIPLETALQFITSNVAKILQIYPQKGTLQENSDADIVILDKNLDIETVIAKGQTMIHQRKIVKKGLFEEISRYNY